MKRVPDAIFVIDTNREEIAIREAHRLNIPVVGTLDTNCDPDDVEYGIPANDDAIRSVKLLADFIADAVVAGTGAPVSAEEMAAAGRGRGCSGCRGCRRISTGPNPLVLHAVGPRRAADGVRGY